MSRIIKKYVLSCPSCQLSKSSNQLPYGHLIPLEIPENRWDTVTMDFITGFQETYSGFDSILVVVDKLTRRAHFIPTKKSSSAKDVAKIFVKEIFRLHGLPNKIISDRDVKFTSKFWSALMNIFDIQLGLSTSYHPQTDGTTERVNRILVDMIKIYCSEVGSAWDEFLPLLEFAYNSAENSTTKQTPFYLDLNYHPRSPLDISCTFNETKVDAALDIQNQIFQNLQRARDLITQSQITQAIYHDQNRQLPNFSVGDWVKIDSKFYPRLTPNSASLKQSHRYIGPFRILRKVSENSFELEIPHSSRIHPTINVSNMRPWNFDEDFDRPIPRIALGNEIEFEVEKIVDQRKVGRRMEFLVKWLNYPDEDSTWEPLKNLRHCRQLIEEYRSQA